jgi:alpha-tubulin suppressor-like RCC1 family protein
MINAQQLINKINTRLSGGGLTDLQTCQLNNALTALQTNDVILVSTFANLPNAADYTGRMIYVDDVNKYYFSTGFSWEDNFSSDNVLFGFIWSWGLGDNEFGQAGINQRDTINSPFPVVGGFTDWCQVSAGRIHSLGVRQNGTAWAWGAGGSGRLGDGTTVNKSSPVSVVGGFTDWCQVSAGQFHSLGVRQNGTAWGWGSNGFGELGDVIRISTCSPVSVVGGFTDWCQVSAGHCQHSLGLRTAGSLWAWGNNGSGQLGDGTIVAKSSPVSVVGGFTDWSQVSAGGTHSLGVRQNGTAWAWGCNVCGRLGDNCTVNRSSPVSVVGGFTDWCQVSAGEEHSLGVRQNGTAWAWGCNVCGRLGDNCTVNRSSPVSVVGGFTDWCQVSAGTCHNLGLRRNGTVWAWGRNNDSQLGDGTNTNRSSPVSVVGGFTDWCQISSGLVHNLAIRIKQKGLS